MKEKIYDIAIVGAGACGLAAAVLLARKGRKVILLEAQAAPARKILLTGNGRCNASNINAGADKYYGDKEIIKSVLSRFGFKECTQFFESIGVVLVDEGEGRLFPASGKAASVADALILAAQEAGVEIITNFKVDTVKNSGGVFVLSGGGNEYRAGKVILATGSAAYKAAGASAGLSYAPAKFLGHNVLGPVAALSGINIKDNPFAPMTGVKAQAALTLRACGAPLTERGEIIFTAYGINGTPAHNLSGVINRAALVGEAAELSLNLFPDIKPSDFKKLMLRRQKNFAPRKIQDFFKGMLSDNAVQVLLGSLGLAKTVLAGRIKEEIFANIIVSLQDWRFAPGAPRSLEEAYAAAGGVASADINAKTLESKLMPGVYIAGELLDVDGISGGFNLHFAFGCAYALAEEL